MASFRGQGDAFHVGEAVMLNPLYTHTFEKAHIGNKITRYFPYICIYCHLFAAKSDLKAKRKERCESRTEFEDEIRILSAGY